LAEIWHAKDCQIKVVDADAVTIDSTASLDTAFSNATNPSAPAIISTYAKDVTITEPEGAIDKIDLIGVDSNSFQNAVLDLKPYGLARLTCTMIIPGDEIGDTDGVTTLEEYVYTKDPNSPSGYSRYQPKYSGRETVAILVTLNDGVDVVNFVLDNAYIIDLGDRRLSGADGHWEMELEAVCLPKDFYIEYKD